MITAKEILKQIDEAKSPDWAKVLDQRAKDYMDEQTSTPEKAKAFFAKQKMYFAMARRTDDEEDKFAFELMAYLPEKIAKNEAANFFQSEHRSKFSKTHSGGVDDEEGRNFSGADLAVAQGRLGLGGVFDSGDSSSTMSAERKTELTDLYDHLLNKSGLSKQAKIVIITRLLLGGSTGGSRQKRGSKITGVKLDMILKNLPREYKQVVQQIKDISELHNDVDPKYVKNQDSRPFEVNQTQVFNGMENESGDKVKRLLGKRDVLKATKEIQKAMIKLSGGKSTDVGHNRRAKDTDAYGNKRVRGASNLRSSMSEWMSGMDKQLGAIKGGAGKGKGIAKPRGIEPGSRGDTFTEMDVGTAPSNRSLKMRKVKTFKKRNLTRNGEFDRERTSGWKDSPSKVKARNDLISNTNLKSLDDKYQDKHSPFDNVRRERASRDRKARLNQDESYIVNSNTKFVEVNG